MNIELTLMERIGEGSKIIHHEIRGVPKPEQRNRIIRQMLADLDDKFSTKKRASRWKKDNAD